MRIAKEVSEKRKFNSGDVVRIKTYGTFNNCLGIVGKVSTTPKTLLPYEVIFSRYALHHLLAFDYNIPITEHHGLTRTFFKEKELELVR